MCSKTVASKTPRRFNRCNPQYGFPGDGIVVVCHVYLRDDPEVITVCVVEVPFYGHTIELRDLSNSHTGLSGYEILHGAPGGLES